MIDVFTCKSGPSFLALARPTKGFTRGRLEHHNFCWINLWRLICTPSWCRLQPLYVDDFSIFFVATNMRTVECRLQLEIGWVEHWVNLAGYQFSEKITVVVHFCRRIIVLPWWKRRSFGDLSGTGVLHGPRKFDLFVPFDLLRFNLKFDLFDSLNH